jgi:flagellar biosynthesis protein
MSDPTASPLPADDAATKPVAVALRYDREQDPAPRVVAKGRGEIAEAIRTIAEENGVLIRRDAPLASLLEAVELDQVIPVEAYVAVAQIISYLYQQRRGGAGAQP